MRDSPHECFHTLFEQLGLPAESAAIETFIARHRLLPGQKIYEANFWNDSQQSFLKSALSEDAEWAVPVDSLAIALTHA